jgi:hypothetical protein
MSSEMLRRVVLVRADVSEEFSASFIRVTRNGELGTQLTSNRRTLRASVASEIRSSETSVLTRATWRNIPEDGIPHGHRRENFRSYIDSCVLDLGTSWRGMASFTPLPHCPLGYNPGNHLIECWMDNMEKRKFLIQLGFELRSLDNPARSQWLHRLRYRGS